jgi:hypothetical protein
MPDASIIRHALAASLPAETSTFGAALPPERFYVPPSHLRALVPDATIVVGARGVGKTVWAAMLTDDQSSAIVEFVEARLRGVRRVRGFSERVFESAYPSEATFRKLLETGHDASDIWRGVIARGLTGLHHEALPVEDWTATVAWVRQNPEAYARLLESAEGALHASGEGRMFVFDALDRSARAWATMDDILRGLLRVILSLKSVRGIYTKVFLRDDQLTRAVTSFPDASKLSATQVELSWQPHDLHALLWQSLLNGPDDHGLVMRDVYAAVTGHAPDARFGFSSLHSTETRDGDSLKALFQQLAGPWMGRDRRRGNPYSWVVGHLADANGRTAPRSFLAAIRSAALDSAERHSSHPFPLHFESVKRGVQGASRIRVQELVEDFPWVDPILAALHGENVPAEFALFERKWSDRFPDGVPGEDAGPDLKLPPQGAESWHGVTDHLLRLGIFERMRDGRLNMPDLYRVGFGLGRRGGVMPVKR